MSRLKRITAVMVTYNSQDCIADAVAGLRAALPEVEVLVVDNASADGTAELVTGLADVRLVRSHKNVGFGRGCNAGAAAASGEWVLFVNPDVAIDSVDRDALEALLDESRPTGVIGFGLSHHAGEGHELPVWRFEGWRRAAFYATWNLLMPRALKISRFRRSRNGRGWASGALFLVRRGEFLSLGGFDARYFLYHEEVDLCRRYVREGMSVRGSLALTGVHEGGGSSGTSPQAATNRQVQVVLGTLQYLSTHEPDAGERYALAVVRNLRTMTRLAGVASRMLHGSPRVSRKQHEVTALQAALEDLARRGAYVVDGDAYYPDAVALLRREWGGV